MSLIYHGTNFRTRNDCLYGDKFKVGTAKYLIPIRVCSIKKETLRVKEVDLLSLLRKEIQQRSRLNLLYSLLFVIFSSQ